MIDFMPSIVFLCASSAPGGLVTKVPVVCVSLHPTIEQTPASAIGKTRLPTKYRFTLEHIGTFRYDWT
jgi:hypothetical protein